MATRAAANPTKADIVRVLIIQAHADAERRLEDFAKKDNKSTADGQNMARLRGEVSALSALKTKVVAYLDRGDISVLIR